MHYTKREKKIKQEEFMKIERMNDNKVVTSLEFIY